MRAARAVIVCAAATRACAGRVVTSCYVVMLHQTDHGFAQGAEAADHTLAATGAAVHVKLCECPQTAEKTDGRA